MLDLAAVGPGDVLYDLGCGDGRIVIGAAGRGASGVGVDIDRLRVREGNWNAERAGVTDRVRFVRDSLFDVDLRPASVVTLYLLPSINRKLRTKLLRELRTGSRIVSNYFDMDDWQPDGRVEAWGRILYLWVVPAWVEGRWHCVLNHPDGRRHMTLRLSRRYQKVTGTVRAGRAEVPLEDGRLLGDRLSFWFRDKPGGARLRCTGNIQGAQIRGTCHDPARPDASKFGWAGRREV
jgi:SAM-dependent methyltransferase